MKRCLRVFYFNILNIAKFGQIKLWIIFHLRKHHKIEKKNNSLTFYVTKLNIA
jgi:hypothetical protein